MTNFTSEQKQKRTAWRAVNHDGDFKTTKGWLNELGNNTREARLLTCAPERGGVANWHIRMADVDFEKTDTNTYSIVLVLNNFANQCAASVDYLHAGHRLPSDFVFWLRSGFVVLAQPVSAHGGMSSAAGALLQYTWPSSALDYEQAKDRTAFLDDVSAVVPDNKNALADSVDRSTNEFLIHSSNPSDRLASKFKPSFALASFWGRAIKQDFEAASRDAKRPERLERGSEFSADELIDAFQLQLKRVIGQIGNRFADKIETNPNIAINKQFPIDVQYKITSKILIDIAEGGDFFALLFNELHAFLTAGGIYGGDWGHLIARGDSILIETNDRYESNDFFDDDSWEVSQVER